MTKRPENCGAIDGWQHCDGTACGDCKHAKPAPKHTPGPWEAGTAYKSGQDDYYAVIFAPTKTEHFHSPRPAEVIGVTKEEAEANAALVAAAPALLEALEALLERAPIGLQNADLAAQARAAIALATA